MKIVADEEDRWLFVNFKSSLEYEYSSTLRILNIRGG